MKQEWFDVRFKHPAKGEQVEIKTTKGKKIIPKEVVFLHIESGFGVFKSGGMYAHCRYWRYKKESAS